MSPVLDEGCLFTSCNSLNLAFSFSMAFPTALPTEEMLFAFTRTSPARPPPPRIVGHGRWAVRVARAARAKRHPAAIGAANVDFR
eukprot:1354018-Amorphochlora_amoeboformis.AAC.1